MEQPCNLGFSKIFDTINEVSLFAFGIIEDSSWTFTDASIKATEEIGELSEAVMILCGRMPHKKLNEHHLSENADNLMMIFDMLSFITHSALILDISLIESKLSKIYDEYFHMDSEKDIQKKVIGYFLEFRIHQYDLMLSKQENLNIEELISLIIGIGIGFHFLVSSENDFNSFLDAMNKIILEKLNKWKSVAI